MTTWTKRVLTPGDAGCSVQQDSTCLLEYTLFKIVSESEAVKVDSSLDRCAGLRLECGQSTVVPVVEQCVLTMSRGERAQFRIPGDLLRGALLAGQDAPHDGDYRMDLEVKRIDSPAAKTTALVPGERISQATLLKETGNTQVASGSYSQAVESYSAALKALDSTWSCTDEEKAQIGRLIVVVNSNLAQVYLHMEKWQNAVKAAQAALAADKRFLKAAVRLARAYAGLHEFDSATSALEDFVSVCQHKPDVETARAELARHAAAQKKAKANEKAMFSKMFTS